MHADISLHTEAVDRYLDLQDAVEATLGEAFQRLGKTTEDEWRSWRRKPESCCRPIAPHRPVGISGSHDDQAFDEALQAVRDAIFSSICFVDEAAFMSFVAALVEANPLQLEPEALTGRNSRRRRSHSASGIQFSDRLRYAPRRSGLLSGALVWLKRSPTRQSRYDRRFPNWRRRAATGGQCLLSPLMG
jgi:hypothetical protein